MKNNILLIILTLICTFFIASNINAQWVQTNGPYGGSVQCIVNSGTNLPTGQADIFVGTWGRGIFLSTNNGSSWTAVRKGLRANCTVWSLAISPNGAGGTNVFAGSLSSGVYLSTNNGSDWIGVNTGLPANASIYSLAAFPNQTSSTNLPTGQAGIFAGTSSNGVYLTTNNGSSWFAVNTGLPANASINSLAVSGKNIFAGIYNAGIFLSMNNGTSWSYCGFKGSNIQSIAASDSIVFAGIENSISSGVFRSTDNGTTWNKTSLNNSDVGVLTVSHEGASSASGGMNIFAGTGDGLLYQSTDKGTNWNQINTGWMVNPVIQAIGVFSTGINTTNILAGTTEGNYLSTDNGTSWVESNAGLTGLIYHALAASPIGAGGTNLFAGTESDIFLSTDCGTSWRTVNNGFIDNGFGTDFSLTVLGTNVFAGGVYNAYFSTNNGTSWSSIGKSGLFQITSIAACSNGEGGTDLFTASVYSNYGVYCYFNNGVSWSLLNMINSGWAVFSSITSFAIQGSNIFAGTSSNGIFLSTNFGVNWNAVNNGLTNIHISALAISPVGTGPNGAGFAKGGTNLFAGTSNSVFLSTDNGSSWNAANNGLPMDTAFTAFACYGSNIFTGTKSGVFLSTNYGASWAEFNTGLPADFVPLSMAISGLNIFAVTQNSVWSRPLSEFIPSVWQAAIKVRDYGNDSLSLTFGQSPIATDSIDTELGEASLPPVGFGFDARFRLPDGDASWKDYRFSNEDSVKWLIDFQAGSKGYPVTFTWDNSKLPAGDFNLKDNITGTLVNVNMKTNSSYSLINTGINELQIAATGTPTSVAANVDPALPANYSLSQNYPNPFNPSTVIRYGLPGISNVKITIYNLIGQEVESLVNETQSAGYHEVVWNASNKASGVYLYSIQAVQADGKGIFRSAKKLILLK